jgi:4-hydroxy-3-methylbut-2-enyl diphosphate reductase
MELILAQPRGFCAGVVRAIDIVELALQAYQPPVYVFHEIVHNRHVVDDLKKRGAIFVNRIDAIPERAVTVFSAHGVSNAVVAQAEARRLQIIDATCPLVTKVHLQCRRYAADGYTVIIVGHLGHEEVDGTLGSFDGEAHVIATPEEVHALTLERADKIAYVTQTTLSVDDTRDVISALKSRFPAIVGPGLDDICYATQNRQNAVRELVKTANVLLVVGAGNSSNSNRLREVGEQCATPSYLIEDQSQLRREWFQAGAKVAISAGASAPEALVQRVIERLEQWGATTTRTIVGVAETTVFKMPRGLIEAAQAQRNGVACRSAGGCATTDHSTEE